MKTRSFTERPLMVGIVWVFMTSSPSLRAAEAGAQGPERSVGPVTPNASPEARALLQYLYSVTGKHTLTGQHNFPNTGTASTDAAARFYGKLPAVYGQDFGFAKEGDHDSYLARPAIIEEIKRQHHRGAIISLCWHAVRPTDDEPVTFRRSVQGKLTDEDVASLDVYRSDFKQAYYDNLLKLAAGKPIGLAEVGPAPTLAVLEGQPKWTWWMVWAGMIGGRFSSKGANNPLQVLVDNPRSYSLSDPEYLESITPTRAACGLPPAGPAARKPER